MPVLRINKNADICIVCEHNTTNLRNRLCVTGAIRDHNSAEAETAAVLVPHLTFSSKAITYRFLLWVVLLLVVLFFHLSHFPKNILCIPMQVTKSDIVLVLSFIQQLLKRQFLSCSQPNFYLIQFNFTYYSTRKNLIPLLKVEFFITDQIYHRCVNLCSFTDAGSFIHYTIIESGRIHHIRSKIYNGEYLPLYRAI